MDTNQFHIFIEAGHGIKRTLGIKRKDPGACQNGRKERDMNIIMAKALKAKLEGKVQTHFVGVETEATLQDKTFYINKAIRENKFLHAFDISLHMNSNPSSKPRGFEMFFQKGRLPAQNLSLSVSKAMTEYNVIAPRANNVKSTAQGKYGRFYIDDMVCPSILIEVAFISNLEDCILVEKNVDRIAESIAHGILEHIRSL